MFKKETCIEKKNKAIAKAEADYATCSASENGAKPNNSMFGSLFDMGTKPAPDTKVGGRKKKTQKKKKEQKPKKKKTSKRRTFSWFQ